ncbi:glycosyl hydrolase [Salegentibacter sp. JZCK2]|uniref:sialidase family protein n=1 Tax=Salegentibacter tibetensis TaxID=2873600 RepID=UPI001CCF0B20|nr:sialidase family protein [Salegentibacter tibetensis]MBZ9728391.1 glycosyl hydrolase [Salegentibacter tibetensis]
MKISFLLAFLCQIFLSISLPVQAQQLTSENFNGLDFRAIGPAFTSGRIADIAIDPEDENLWYVGVGSGGVWKTENSGTTWKPIFDDQGSYSIGAVTIDPNNSNTIWIGTGENVGGRHVAYGDGVYVSHDNGDSWESMGLKKSEHIGKIIVHPENSDIIWVAAEGPLWSKGGERGVFKSNDGGKTWKKTLGGNEWTGTTSLVIDPTDPDVLYAATWQRHRNVAAYMGGGPGSGLHKSTDGGETWKKLTKGIPESNLGKIGLAISPFDPEIIYAAIELDRKKGGVFMSSNRGASWTKMSDAVSGGTGPHYYQELYASPHQEGRLYLMSNYVQISEDHGKTFEFMNEETKHVDSHAMAFKMSDPSYLLFGTDGGLYESFDHTKTWRYVRNLPITQYYKIAVDDSEPFYNIYGGTQDNGSHGGPSRTLSESGIKNSDWWITLGADGHQSAIEPGNPDITYGEYQQGMLFRIDQTTGEKVLIQPQPGEGEPYERFNWDAPILVSPHKPTRLYFASQRVWRSENRGDEWTAISSDLTRNQDRLTLPIMGAQQSWDNPWDVGAMSNYNTITSLAESPKQEGLLYAGTDDGIIQVSEDGGNTWRKTEVGKISEIPATAFVNDLRADLFDANTVYAALDNHKYGDYKPYLLKSTDKGKSWKSMNGDLPKNLITWRLVQDHKQKDLLFAATEYGIYFTKNGGNNWIQLKGNLPVISFRDIAIQRREDDLVGGSFGRGIFILDDLSPIREFNPNMLTGDASLFDVKPAYRYIEKDALYAQGATEYAAENPPYGAVFTYFLPEKFKSAKELRQEKEKELAEEKEPTPFAGWEQLEEEVRQEAPAIFLTVKDKDGKVVNRVKGTNEQGFNRANWKLDYADKSGVMLGESEENSGLLVTTGEYTVSLDLNENGTFQKLAGPEVFQVVPLTKGALDGASNAEIEEFRKQYEDFNQKLTAANTVLDKNLQKIDAMKQALQKASNPNNDIFTQLHQVRERLLDLEKALKGDKVKGEVGERSNPTPGNARRIASSALNTTYGPTANHKAAFQAAKNQLERITTELKEMNQQVIPELEKQLKSAGAPWIEGQEIPD